MQTKHRKNKYTRTPVKWTIERLIESGSLCSTKNEFKKRFPGAYHAACARGLLDQVTGHIPRLPRSGVQKWTLEKAREVAAMYKSLAAFHRDYSGLYTMAHLNGWFDEITAHIPRQKKGKPRIWTRQSCADAASKCETRTQFRHAYSSAYVIAKREGWLQDICSHMKISSGLAVRSVYVLRKRRTETIYIGISFDPLSRYYGHKRRPAPLVRDIIESDHSFHILASNLPTDNAASLERRLIARFRRLGFDVRNTKCGGDIGGNKLKWTDAALKAVAMKCGSRREMSQKYASAYTTACQRGVIDELFAGHENGGYEHRTRRKYGKRQNKAAPSNSQVTEPSDFR